MDPRGFLKLAEHLAARGDAASRRSAISRAYYAVFHVAKAFLEQAGRLAGKHGEVAAALGESTDPEVQRVGVQIGDFYTKRQRADYALTRTDVEDPRNARACCEEARRLIVQIDSWSRDPRRSAVLRSLPRRRT